MGGYGVFICLCAIMHSFTCLLSVFACASMKRVCVCVCVCACVLAY